MNVCGSTNVRTIVYVVLSCWNALFEESEYICNNCIYFCYISTMRLYRSESASDIVYIFMYIFIYCYIVDGKILPSPVNI
jgi:hypothetical protein